MPVGSIVAYAGDIADDSNASWRPCLGQPVKSRDYPGLHSLIGSSWGNGDNSGADFNLPDLRGMFLRGAAMGAAADPDRTHRVASIPNVQERNGASSGDAVGSLQSFATAAPLNPITTDNAPDHSHPLNLELSAGRADGGVRNTAANPWFAGPAAGNTGGAGGHSHKTEGGGDAETRPINAAVVYLIRVK